jgi:DNA-binding NarL/FixJ family response regulator
MPLTSRAADWQAIEVGPQAWRRPDLTWDAEHLIDLAVLASASPSAAEFAPSLVSRIVTSDRLRSWEAVTIDAGGGLHRDHLESPHSGLLAWSVSCLWGDNAVAEALEQGIPRVEVRDAGTEVDAIACLPLIHGDAFDSIIAVWITAQDTHAAIECASRLTLVGHLWSAIRPSVHEAPAEFGADVVSDFAADILTPRQSFILESMAEGLTNSQIAQRINFSESTVRLESMVIYRHFGVHSRLEAVSVARAVGEL